MSPQLAKQMEGSAVWDDLIESIAVFFVGLVEDAVTQDCVLKLLFILRSSGWGRK